MKKLIIANWKMNPASLAEAEDIVAKLDENIRTIPEPKFDLVICPPFVFIEEIAKFLQGMSAQLGAQDVAFRPENAQTGEVSGAQLAKLGVRYVIIGHSDRRWKFGEDDATVNSKLKTALAEGLTPVVCLGERTREGNWQDELKVQTVATFRGLTSGQIGACVIAYEPVWAISTTPGAKPDTPASAVQSMSIIREVLADHYQLSTNNFLYGGSVTPGNVRDFLERSEISGVLVGAASLRPDDFAQILSIASQMS